jgi:mycofactocin precursor peptide peptidase
MSHKLDGLTWAEAQDRRHATLLVPLGATEQHGPHLPLSTDTDIAVALVERTASLLPNVLVAPALPYGSSGEHQDFAGTISIGQSALHAVLVALSRSAAVGFERIVFVCAHGGNAEPVATAVAQLRGEGHAVSSWFPNWGGDAHAGRIETALMLALHPSRVQGDLARRGATAPLVDLMPALRSHGVRAVTENGVLGDPDGATRDEGRGLLERATSDLIAFLS